MPLDVMTDLLHRYMSEVCRLTHRYTEHFGRTEPNVDDLGLAFLDMGISVPELEEYINNVDCLPYPHPLPALPVSRPSNLNFLKPGTRETLSRPIHIHEHLPPMYPEKEEEEVEVKVSPGMDEGMGESPSPAASPQPAVKRAADADASPAKKAKYSVVEEGNPVREIVSVMMTTSGFISSAREGKLPEARCPNIPMVTARSSSPSNTGPAGRKKLNVEKLIRQKNNQGLIGRPLPNKPPRPIKIKGKEKLLGKGLKVLGSKPPHLPKPGGPSGMPGSLPMPPSLKMPMPKVIVPKNSSPKVSTPKVHHPKPQTPKPSPPKPTTPKVHLPKPPTPKIKVPKPPKTPKSESKKSSNPGGTKDEEKDSESKKPKKEKDQTKKSKEGKKEKDSSKKPKEPKKEKESKKEKEIKKEKEGKKEKEIKKEKERERELILALASSSAVTITSIPTPGKAGPEMSGQEKEGKSKLSIFKKINKTKDSKELERPSERDGQPSRDSSPVLMIDETAGKIGQRRIPEDLHHPENPPRRLEMPVEVSMRSPGGFSSFQDDMSPPGTPSTPRTPEIPHLPIRKTPEKRKGKEKAKDKRPRKDRSKSPKGGFSPGHRELPCDFESTERPKTPELELPMNDSPSPFSLPPFPTAPGFIPPFSRFPFIPPFGGPPRPVLPHSPMPDLRLPPHPFLPRPTKRSLEDDHLHLLDEPENLERPLTPRHDVDVNPLPSLGSSHPSPLRSPSPTHLAATPPRPRTPAARHSPPPPPAPKVKSEKVDKGEKEKKKEHKKEKKEKEKEKEKVKKKKDKKDKEKEKDKSDKRKEKEKTKQEKKVKKEKDDGSSNNAPRITMKLTSSSTSAQSSNRSSDTPITPKLVIKPVVKQEEDPPHSKSQEDQPGSPEIAKFSALITRPPRNQHKRADSPQPLPVLKIKDMQTSSKKGDSGKVKEVPPLKIKNPGSTKTPGTPKSSSGATSKNLSIQKQQQSQPGSAKLSTSPRPSSNKPSSVPKVQEEKKSPGSKKSKDKKEKKEKKMKEAAQPGSMNNPGMASGSAVKGGSAADQPPFASHQPTHSAMPVMPPPQDTPKPNKKQEQKSTGLLTETVGPIGHFVDDQGNEVWICPTCGKQDDGSPMIGCDTCDDWYHWVCVGIQVPPSDDVNWYCPRCVSQHKQRGVPPEKKKRGRKKK
ncbi:hypothetical protein Pcinc_035186 [Petrolisthes cinctipes]|uniref:PHD-type domain-containing protein n=1 Tax=Petrolisthes cinctipes TaxID=88211 RepID=A0AAE1ENY8_PETCI|nr:hypothetical protein Pcinc_035186 [Petrolisthes cinctipes]